MTSGLKMEQFYSAAHTRVQQACDNDQNAITTLTLACT